MKNNARRWILRLFTSHLNKPLTIDLYFIRYHPCAFLSCHLIAALIKNQVCATLGLWEKAVESHQPILINIEKRGFACLSQSNHITDPKFSNFEFVRVNAFHLFTNRFRAHSSRSRTRIARAIIVCGYHKAMLNLVFIAAAAILTIFLGIVDLVNHKYI